MIQLILNYFRTLLKRQCAADTIHRSLIKVPPQSQRITPVFSGFTNPRATYRKKWLHYKIWRDRQRKSFNSTETMQFFPCNRFSFEIYDCKFTICGNSLGLAGVPPMINSAASCSHTLTRFFFAPMPKDRCAHGNTESANSMHSAEVKI